MDSNAVAMLLLALNTSFFTFLPDIPISNHLFSIFSKSTLRSTNFYFQIELLWNSIHCISKSSMSFHENIRKFTQFDTVWKFNEFCYLFQFSKFIKSCKELLNNWFGDVCKQHWRHWQSVLTSFGRSLLYLFRFGKYLNLSLTSSHLKTSSFIWKVFM